MKRAILFSALVFCLFSCSAKAFDPPSMREKIARMLLVGFDGKKTEELEDVKKLIKEEKVGGVVIFANNAESPESLKELCRYLRNVADYPLLIGIDQEGGHIQRLKSKNGFKDTPSQQWLGKNDEVKTTALYADTLSSQLKDMGINLNFAPVVDLNVNPSSPIIGKYERAFSDAPEKVACHAAAEIEAHHRNGILTCLKHFPGHGSSLSDSHLGLTDITETWNRQELDPYKTLIDSGYGDMIMVGHLFNRNIDNSYPASLSEKTINGLLRGELGWQGVVVTDDMQMGAITENYGQAEALKLAINAGADMLVTTRRGTGALKETIDELEKAVENGEIKEERINEAYKRITALTEKL